MISGRGWAWARVSEGGDSLGRGQSKWLVGGFKVVIIVERRVGVVVREAGKKRRWKA